MKKLFLPLFLLVLAPCFAQQDPDEIITDFGIDEFIYVPKSTLNFGVRYMTGAKVSFSSKPTAIGSLLAAGDATSPGVLRQYSDGSYVGLPTTSLTGTNADGTTTSVPITVPEHYTNTWSYPNSNQATGNTVAMKSYTADVAGMDPVNEKADPGTGVELTVTKDLGKLFGTKIRWGITGGASLNDIHASIKQRQMMADVTTLTDTYTANGPTTAPYTAPTSSYNQLKDAEGNLVWDDDAHTIPTYDFTQPIDTSVLLSNVPTSRDYSMVTGETGMVTSSFLLKGSYYTLRVGPTFYIPLTDSFRISISAGGTAVFSGTNYRVVTVFTPSADETPITQDVSTDESKLMFGYYVDANLEYTFTEATGVYLGAVYQTSGGYDQSITANGQAIYTTHIDLKQLQGVRGGMTFKF